MKIEIIGEIANAHQGSVKKAINLANAAFMSRADAVKFQVYFANEMLSPKHKRFQHFKKQSFSKIQWLKIFNFCRKKKIKFYCDVFGLDALKFVQKNNVKGIKIHSSDMANKQVLSEIKTKKVFLSCGGANINEIAYAVNICKKKRIKPILLHGFQSYPTEPLDVNFSRFGYLKEIFQDFAEFGYQDHSSGSSQYHKLLPFFACGMGATYLEKHITFDRKKKGVDYYSSIEPKDFSNFVKLIRNLEKSYNGNIYQISKKEKIYREDTKKIYFVKKDIPKKYTLKSKDLVMLRSSNHKVKPQPIENFIGKKTIRKLKKFFPIRNVDLKQKIIVIIVARSRSKRLPNKASKLICGYTTLDHLIRRVKKSKTINQIILCTTKKKEDLNIIKIAKKNKISFFRGDNKNVLNRMLSSLKNKKFDHIVRITGDDILIDPDYLDIAVRSHLRTNSDYTDHKKLPSGTETEIFSSKLLKNIMLTSYSSEDTEYLTNYVTDSKSEYICNSAPVKFFHQKRIRLTIDTKKDFIRVTKFLKQMKNENKLFDYRMNDIIKFFKKNDSKISLKKKIQINTNKDWSKLIY
tara:strand:- start:5538 stop:7265 length:1728 start_codon:yes stop_codon:yes gene_type:complete